MELKGPPVRKATNAPSYQQRQQVVNSARASREDRAYQNRQAERMRTTAVYTVPQQRGNWSKQEVSPAGRAKTTRRNGLTARMMMKATRAVAIPLKNVERCKVVALKKSVLKTKKYGEVPMYQFRVRDPGSATQPARTHTVDVILRDGAQYDKKTMPKFTDMNTNLLVSCTCEWFCFYSEYALTKYNASWIRYCNGESPKVTNPGLVPVTCKHLYRVFDMMLMRGL